MHPSLSLNHVFTNAPFYERFALAADAGFNYVELGSWTDLDITRVNDELQRNQLELASLTGSTHDLSKPETHGDFIEHLSQSIAIAKLFECEHVIIESTLSSSSAVSAADTTILAQDDLRGGAIATRILISAAQRAERAGVTLCLKPPHAGHLFLPGLRLAGNVITAVHSFSLRLLLDATELWKFHDSPDISRVMQRVCQLIGYIHVGHGSTPDEWREELSWITRHVIEFYSLDCFAGLLYPARDDDTDMLQKFLLL